MKKRNFILAGILVILIILFSMIATPILTQEDNTIAVLSGIAKLTFGKSEIVKYDNDESFAYYITKSELGEEPIESMLFDEYFVLSDQMGSAYIFTKENDNSTMLIL